MGRDRKELALIALLVVLFLFMAWAWWDQAAVLLRAQARGA